MDDQHQRELHQSSRLQRLLSILGSTPATEPDEPRLVGAEAVRAHEERQEAQLGDHLARCGVPAGISRLVLEGLTIDGYPAVPVVRGWLSRPNAVFLLMAGGVGTGKSCAAAEACKTARKAWWGFDSDGNVIASWQYASERALFLTAARLASASPWSDEGKALWSRVRSVPLLVLDDLGVESTNQKGPFLADFQDLIGDRHGNERRTVITTNLDASTFRSRYGVRVLERLQEKGIACNVGNVSKRERLT